MNLISQVKMKLTLMKKNPASKKNNLTRLKMKFSLLRKNKMHLKNCSNNPLPKNHRRNNWNKNKKIPDSKKQIKLIFDKN